MKKILTALALVLSLLMLLACNGQPVQVEVINARDFGGGAPLTRAAGDSNFTNVVASGDVTSGDDVIVGDTLDVDGDLDLDGDAFDVDITGGFSIDGDAASNVSVAGAGIDLDLVSAAGRVVIQASEAAADAVYIDADGAAGVGLDIDVGSSGGMSVDGGCLNIGGGTPASCGDNDAYVTGDFEVDAALDVDGTIDHDGTTFDVSISGVASIDAGAASNYSVSGAGIDLSLVSAAGRVVIQASEATADAVFIDADGDAAAGLDIDVGATNGMSIDGGCLNIGGGSPASCGDNDAYVTGDLEVDTVLDLDGSLDMDGTAMDFELSAGFSIDGDTASNISLSAQDLTIEAETGSIILKGDEAAADAILLDADDAAGVGVTIAVGSSGGLNIGGGCTNIGGGSPGSCGDNDLYVTADLEVDAALDVDGATTLDATTVDGDLTVSADSTGGNLNARNEFVGLPRWGLVDLGAGTNPGSETVDCMDNNPAGEWTDVDSGTNVTPTADTSYYRYDTNSMKYVFGATIENDGIQCAIPAQDDFQPIESIGFWIYTDEAITSGDFDVTLDDDAGTDQEYAMGAVSADVWTWVEIDTTACANADCDTVDHIWILLTSQGAGNLSTPTIYIDELYYWDIDDEEALGQNITDFGVIGVMTSPTAGNGLGTLAEWTDYIIHYQSGSDFIVWVSDQSANDNVAFIAY